MGVYVGNEKYTPYIGDEKKKVIVKKILPYDAEIEYLESTGTQWIDTGIIPDTATGFEAQVVCNNNNDTYLIGLRNDSGNTRWGVGHLNNGFYWNYGSYQDSGRLTGLSADIKLNYLNDKKYIATNGNSTVNVSLPSLSFVPAYNIRLFGSAGVVASYSKWSGKINYVKITQGNALVMDFIPVRVGNVGYMYDKITGQLFGNNGTGDFILGQDKQKETTVHDYVTDGLVFHLDGIEKGATDGSWIDLVGGKVFTANNSTYIQPAVDGFTFIGGSNDINVMINNNGLVGTANWTMEAVCSPTTWGTFNCIFSSSNRGCGLTLDGRYLYSNNSSGGWVTNITSDHIEKVTLSLNKDIGLLNGEQLTTMKSSDQWTTTGFRVGSCQSKNHNFYGTIHSIRMYNRSLTLEERLHNQRIDNIRFNLGLNI